MMNSNKKQSTNSIIKKSNNQEKSVRFSDKNEIANIDNIDKNLQNHNIVYSNKNNSDSKSSNSNFRENLNKLKLNKNLGASN